MEMGEDVEVGTRSVSDCDLLEVKHSCINPFFVDTLLKYSRPTFSLCAMCLQLLIIIHGNWYLVH